MARESVCEQADGDDEYRIASIILPGENRDYAYSSGNRIDWSNGISTYSVRFICYC